MAIKTKPLTNTEVKQAKPKDKAYKLFDGDGLQLRVMPNGSKTWLFDYKRPYTKKRTTLSLGAYPARSIAQARKKRFEARELLAKDIDPQEHRIKQELKNQAANAQTLEYVASLWLGVKKAEVSASHAEDTWRSLELHIFPNLGKLPIHKISAPKVIATIQPVASKGSLETVKRLCQRLNEIMVHAVNTGLIAANPLTGIRKAFQNPTKRHLPTLKPEQLPKLLHTLSIASIKYTTRSLIEWQLHTMVRPSEAAGARWDEIDFNSSLWHIPAERMKSKKSHTVSLSSQVLDLLELMKPISLQSD
jgi:integrase